MIILRFRVRDAPQKGEVKSLVVVKCFRCYANFIVVITFSAFNCVPLKNLRRTFHSIRGENLRSVLFAGAFHSRSDLLEMCWTTEHGVLGAERFSTVNAVSECGNESLVLFTQQKRRWQQQQLFGMVLCVQSGEHMERNHCRSRTSLLWLMSSFESPLSMSTKSSFFLASYSQPWIPLSFYL